MRRRASAGVRRKRIEQIIALSPADLPAPVAPATRRCGIDARSATAGWPIASRPSARASGAFDSLNSFERRISRRDTVDGSAFGTSMATLPRPGTGPNTRTAPAFIASARSSARFTTWLTLIPGPGSNSYPVMTGPGLIRAMCPLTPKSSSRFRRCSAFWRSSSSLSVRRVALTAGALRSDTGGSWNVAPGWANPKISCFAAAAVRRARGRSSLAPSPGPPRGAAAPRSGRGRAPAAAPPRRRRRPARGGPRSRAPAGPGAARPRRARAARRRGCRGAGRGPAAPGRAARARPGARTAPARDPRRTPA